MDDKTLYGKLLGLTPPWGIEKVELKLTEGEVHLWVTLPPKELWVCPECLARAPIHDHRDRAWRHLDTFQYKTILHARVPRLNCPNHGIRQLRVPWAEDRSRFTALFEALAIDWMKEASISAVAERLRLSWDELAGIQERAVQRGLARRKLEVIRFIGVDETSYQKRHQYVTIVSDLGHPPRVLYVAQDRVRGSLNDFWGSLNQSQLEGIEAVVMDMWESYLGSAYRHLPNPDGKIVIDKYHVAALLNRAVDQVRAGENRELLRHGRRDLVGTKFLWLKHPDHIEEAKWQDFQRLRQSNLKTARAWALKETAMALYDSERPSEAAGIFRQWHDWATRSRLEPMIRTAQTLQSHWDEIFAWFRHRVTNAAAEGINAQVQRIKFMARGFRNRKRFRNAIYFHLGRLDLYPAKLSLQT